MQNDSLQIETEAEWFVDPREWFAVLTVSWVTFGPTNTATISTGVTVPSHRTQAEIYQQLVDGFRETYGIPSGATWWVVNYTIVPNQQR